MKRPKYSGDFAKLNIRVLFAGQLANELTSHRLFPGDTIDSLAQQDSVSNVSCILRDHVVIDPTQRRLTESLVVEAIVERRSHECFADRCQFVQIGSVATSPTLSRNSRYHVHTSLLLNFSIDTIVSDGMLHSGRPDIASFSPDNIVGE